MASLNVTSATGTLSIAGQELLGSWGGTVLYLFLFCFLPLAFLGIGLAVLWNIANYTRFKKYFTWLLGTPVYFMVGIISIVVISIPFAFLYWGYIQAKEGNTVPLEYTFYIILGYVVISFIGWIVSKFIIDRVTGFEKELGKGKRKKKTTEPVGY